MTRNLVIATQPMIGFRMLRLLLASQFTATRYWSLQNTSVTRRVLAQRESLDGTTGDDILPSSSFTPDAVRSSLTAAAHSMTSLSDDDLGGGDFATVDLAGWCVGTTLTGIDADGGATGGGECVRQYFAQLADCYRPAGACKGSFHIRSEEYCWNDGAGVSLGHWDPPTLNDPLRKYLMNGRSCMYAVGDTIDPGIMGMLAWPPKIGDTASFCISTSDYECTTLVVDGGGPQFATFDGHVFTCPDGTRVSVDLRGCPALTALLAQTCSSASATATCTLPSNIP